MKITIIGAGIAGLTSAIALKQKGFEVEIFENTPEFKEAGSGINLAINAMQVYKRLGVYNDIIKASNYTNKMNARNLNFELLTSAKLSKFEDEYKVKTVAIHRAVLHEILLKHVGGTKIHLNKKLTELTQNDDGVLLHFEDGSLHTAQLVIGADGIHSMVRKSLFNNTKLRDAKQVCWRGVANTNVAKQYKNELNEIWGNANRFGFVHINDEQVYWFALINKNKFISKDIDLLETFSNYPQMVKSILKQTPKEAVLFNEIWDLQPINNWYKGSVCLIGDAAHATTPNLGQGAVQAIESALALSICLKEEESVEKAFDRFQNIRMKKANFIVKTSWLVGKIAQLDSSLLCRLRNFIVKLTPSSVADRQNKKVMKLNF